MNLKYFFGTHEVKLIPGGQMALPAKIRRVLEDENVVLSNGFDKCIFGFSPEGWDKMVQAGFDKPVFTADGRTVRRQFFSVVEITQYDSQGRISVPSGLREYAGLKSDVCVIGAGDHFEIWDRQEWEKIKKDLGKGPI